MVMRYQYGLSTLSRHLETVAMKSTKTMYSHLWNTPATIYSSLDLHSGRKKLMSRVSAQHRSQTPWKMDPASKTGLPKRGHFFKENVCQLGL